MREICFTPAAESHGLCPWMNAPDVWPGCSPHSGVKKGATGYARGAPHCVKLHSVIVTSHQELVTGKRATANH